MNINKDNITIVKLNRLTEKNTLICELTKEHPNYIEMNCPLFMADTYGRFTSMTRENLDNISYINVCRIIRNSYEDIRKQDESILVNFPVLDDDTEFNDDLVHRIRYLLDLHEYNDGFLQSSPTNKNVRVVRNNSFTEMIIDEKRKYFLKSLNKFHLYINDANFGHEIKTSMYAKKIPFFLYNTSIESHTNIGLFNTDSLFIDEYIFALNNINMVIRSESSE